MAVVNFVDELFLKLPEYYATLTNGETPGSQELLLMALSFAGNYQAFYNECEI